jgi:UDP-N-acetylglucosamine acyltransferase
MNKQIHPLSVVHPDAQLGQNVVVEPFAVINGDVVIGDNCTVSSHAVIADGVRIGNNCRIFHGAILGAIPQDLKFENEQSLLEIGNNVVIREYCTLNRGTKANYKTVIGDNCLLMAYVHVAHDCVIGNNCILANNVNLAGHIQVGAFTVLGGLTAVHQFVKIGEHAMLSGGSLALKDVPPYIKAARNPLGYAGINSTGLRRRGFSTESIHEIQNIYRLLFVRGYNTSQALHIIENDFPVSPEKDSILGFIRASDRGLLKGFRAS